MPDAHIYPLSRLVHAGPRAWQRLLNEIEAGSTYAFSYYQPMREAVARFCASRGRHKEAVLDEMTVRITQGGGPRLANKLRDNVRAFESFEDDFFPRITRFRHSLLRQRQPGCDFEGLILRGAPHMEVVDVDGRRRHVFLHAANWKPDDLAAYLELLGVIVHANHGGNPSSLWIMDLRAGEDVNWRPTARMRRRCRDTARLYARLVDAIGSGKP